MPSVWDIVKLPIIATEINFVLLCCTNTLPKSMRNLSKQINQRKLHLKDCKTDIYLTLFSFFQFHSQFLPIGTLSIGFLSFVFRISIYTKSVSNFDDIEQINYKYVCVYVCVHLTNRIRKFQNIKEANSKQHASL